MNVVELDQVSFGYSANRLVLNRVNLNLAVGESLAIIGESGIGKTTILRLITGQIRPNSGQIRVCGSDMSQLSKSERMRLRREQIGIVFQQPQLIPELSLIENVSIPGLMIGQSRGTVFAQAGKLLVEFGIDANQPVNTLSGGQASRVGVARALITNPQLVIADEPTASLDPAAATAVAELLFSSGQEDRSVLLVSHDASVAARCSRSLRLVSGEGGGTLVSCR